jgi:hypothetical protein
VISRDKRHNDLTHSAHEAFANHKIVSESDRRWSLRREIDGKTRSEFWTEIVVLDGGSMLVHGDIEHVIFSRYTDTKDPLDVLRWIGECTDFGWYVTQKATIGTGHELIEVIDDAAFRDDLKRIAKEDRGAVIEIRDALRKLDYGEHPKMVLHDLCVSGKVDTESLVGVGKVTDARVYFAHAATKRLCELLVKREAAK